MSRGSIVSDGSNEYAFKLYVSCDMVHRDGGCLLGDRIGRTRTAHELTRCRTWIVQGPVGRKMCVVSRSSVWRDCTLSSGRSGRICKCIHTRLPLSDQAKRRPSRASPQSTGMFCTCSHQVTDVPRNGCCCFRAPFWCSGCCIRRGSPCMRDQTKRINYFDTCPT